MPQIRLYNKQTGVTYVYDSINYYDPEKKQGRSKRKLIGKLDPVTGDIIPTVKVGRASKPKENATHTDAEYNELQAKLERTLSDLVEKENARAELDQKLRATRKDIREYKKLVRKTISVLYASLDSFHPEVDIDGE
ncbi:MAG: CDK5RAP3 family protein [Clostridia bacterium]|nr:CDK5RAP3 family protein [Clostridia bacterium]